MAPLIGSTRPDITETLPTRLGLGDGATLPPEAGWDLNIGNLSFNLKPNASTPYERATEQIRKQQIDTSESAGEQTLGSWWTRSQDTWDLGAGIRWYDPKSDPGTASRFASSMGVDVWTPGQVSLLPAVDTVSTGGSISWVATLNVRGELGIAEFRGETAYRRTAAGVAQSATTGSTGTIWSQPVPVGGRVFAGSNSGIWIFDPDPVTADLSKPITQPGTLVSRVWNVKHRLIVAYGTTLYEVPYSATGSLATVGTEIFQATDPDWVWTDVAETGGAILAAGYSETDSAVFRFTLDRDQTTGDSILGPAEQVLHMPVGEAIHAMGVYLGTVLVLGTSAGVRVGAASSEGLLQYGLLTIETSNPVLDITFRDRFAYVTLTGDMPGGVSGVARVDLSAPTDQDGNLFAWANDVALPLGVTVHSIALLGDRIAMAVQPNGLYLASADELVPEGWIDSGQVRYATAELKAFRYARVACQTRGGQVELRAVTPNGQTHNVVIFDDTYQTIGDVALSTPPNILNQYLSLVTYLRPDEGGTTSPLLTGLSVKAVPAPTRVRLYSYPVEIGESISSRYGQTYTQNPYAVIRALESLEETGAPVLVRDNRVGEVYMGQVDSVSFTNTAPPAGAESGFAGTAVIVVRRV